MRILIAALVAALPLAAQDDGVRFEHKYTKGQIRKFKLTSTSKLVMEFAGNDMGNTSESTQVVREEVLEADDKGGAKMKTTFGDMKMKFKPNVGDEVIFDSTKKEDAEKTEGNPMLQMMTAYIGKSVTMHRSKRGENTKLDVSEIEEAVQGTQGAGMVEGMVRLMVETTGIEFPDKPLKKDEKWKQTTEVEMGFLGKMKVETETTHAGDDKVGDIACVKFTSKMTISYDTGDGGMVKVEVKSQDNSATYWFDPSRGEVMKAAYKQKMKTVIEAQGQEIESDQEIAYEMERVKDW